MALVRQLLKPSLDAALAQLMDVNARFASGGLISFDKDLIILKQKTVDKQEPFAAVLSCADSRVPVELVFDQSELASFALPTSLVPIWPGSLQLRL